MRISPTLPSSENTRYHPWLQDLATELAVAETSAGTVLSYIETGMDLFYDHVYPIYPVVYRPHVRSSLLAWRQPGTAWDQRMFLVLTSACAYAFAVLPASMPGASWPASEAFYRVFKRARDAYASEELDQLDSSSVVTRLMIAAWHHTSGSARASWYVLGEAMRVALLMRLYDEKTYESMSVVEGQLCRRVFWTLYTSDQSSCFLGDLPRTFTKNLFWGGKIPKYPEEFTPEDRVTVVEQNGQKSDISILTGFNANQDLWRAAEDLSMVEREYPKSGGTADAISSHLLSAFVGFQTVLDSLPGVLRFHSSVETTVEGFFFADEQDPRRRVPQVLQTQRTNLHISFHFLKLVFLRKYPSLVTGNGTQADLASTTQPPRSHSESLGESDSAMVRETLRIAEDMLYVIHTSGMEALRMNGEPCTEKIRRVGASVLEVLTQGITDDVLFQRATKFRDLYPYLLARLESKASDKPGSADG